MEKKNVEKYAAGCEGRQPTLLRQLVTATSKLRKALCLEYIAAAEDGLGRLYARQSQCTVSGKHDASCMEVRAKRLT